MTDRLRTSRGSRVPPHVVVMLSAATGVYAATLAGVAALQSADEAALANVEPRPVGLSRRRHRWWRASQEP